MSFSEITINSLENVTILSELISSGGGNYYRNKINFYLKVSEELTEIEARSFTTELRLADHVWEVRLVKGLPERIFASDDLRSRASSRHIMLEEEVDMALEDFSQTKYRFPVEGGDATVSFRIDNGKVKPLIKRRELVIQSHF